MAEVDTSIYQRPAALPVQKSALDQAQQFQQMERSNVALSSEKLGLINTQFKLMNDELSNLAADPDATKESATLKLNTFAKTYGFPPEVSNHMIQELQAAPDVKTFAETALRRGMDVNTKLNQTYGTHASATDNSTLYTGVIKPTMQGGGFVPATQAPLQVPPTQEVQRPDLSKGLVGPAGPPGFTPSAGGLPVAGPTGAAGAPTPLPAARPALPVSGATGPTIANGTEFNNRFQTGAAPGIVEAKRAVGEQSGKDYATDLNRARNYQADLQPDLAVLNIVKDKKNSDFGPGTDALNQVKKLAVTWLPNVDFKLINDSTDYDTVKKYLVQGARGAGNTGTNDQLAAAFEANPNTTMNTATIENIVKSRVALRKMQHALPLLFAQQGKPDDEYSKWVAQNQNVLDPRAFGFDMMTNEAKNKVLEGMASKDNAGNWIAKKGKEKEFRKFENSLSFANDAGLIEPPGRK